MAPWTNDDKILITILHLEMGYSAVQMMHEFPARNWEEVCFAILLNTLTWQATLIGKRVVADRNLLELVQISNLSVISYAVVHRI